jgi:hypothetical protein
MADDFTALSDRVAELQVDGRDSEFGLQLDTSPWQRHRLGFRHAPLYELTQPLSPDDAWDVRPLAGGRLRARSNPGEAVRACVRWAATAATTTATAQRSARLLAALPAGRYVVVRSPRQPYGTDHVVLGNERVPSRPYFLALREEPPVYTYLVGTGRGPWIGTVVLDSVGSGREHEMFGFSFDETPGPDREPLLVIPVEGELVVDNMAAYGSEPHARVAWRDRWAESFVLWCAGETDWLELPSGRHR